MNTKEKGDISEAMLIAALLQCRYVVLRPVSDRHRYDMVIENGNGFQRVQCKTGRLRKGSVVFHAESSMAHHGLGRKGYAGDVELFGVYCPDNGKCYLIPIAEIPSTMASLRVSEALNNQRLKIRKASDYELRKPDQE